MSLLVLLLVASLQPPDGSTPSDGSAPHAPIDRPPEPIFYVPLQPTPWAEPGVDRARGPIDGDEPLTGPDGPPRPAESSSPRRAELPPEALPLGLGPDDAQEPIDPLLHRLARIDMLVGPSFRIRPVDLALSTSVEYGREVGFSAAFHTELLPISDRSFVRGFDVPIGIGALVRGKVPGRPLYGSVGLTAGILVHRGKVDERVLHRVDPDFRIPLRFAWTAAGAGTSLAIVPGFSVRERSYERRGVEVLNRHSFRIDLMFGLHWDFSAGRSKTRQPGLRKKR